MKVILFGASGMVGQGVLRECLGDPDVTQVLSIVRTATHQQHPKLQERVHSNFFDFSSLKEEWAAGWDACFFCLGVSSAGMSEEAYRHITYDVTLAAAQLLSNLNPVMTFIYVSGMGTDSSEKGRSMWARVKGKTENDLLRLPFKACMFRPAIIIPRHGVTSKTRLYQLFYTLLGWSLPIVYAIAPSYVTTTEEVGRAMLAVAKKGVPKPLFESVDIRAWGRTAN